ncbi:hypothetical protein Tco_1422309, partial [Tanacetum coccineum]
VKQGAKQEKGGINFTSTAANTRQDLDTVKAICSSIHLASGYWIDFSLLWLCLRNLDLTEASAVIQAQ